MSDETIGRIVFGPSAASTADAVRIMQATAEYAALKRDAARYRRLSILGCAPYGSRNLESATVLRFTNLDEFVDADISAHPSRGDEHLGVESGERSP